MMSKRSSALPLWNFFNRSTDGSKTATCHYCRRLFSYKTSVTNLKQHLKQKHISAYDNLINFGKTLASTSLPELKNENVQLYEVIEEIEEEDPHLQTISEQPSYRSTSTSPQPHSSSHQLKRRSIFKPPFEEKRRPMEANTQAKSQFASDAEVAGYSLDDSQAYANFLASKLRQYSRQTRNALQHEISMLLFQADNGHFQSTAFRRHSSRRSPDPLSTRSPSMEDADD